jgi:hypothetical protein
MTKNNTTDEFLQEEENIIPFGQIEVCTPANVSDGALAEITALGRVLDDLDQSILAEEVTISDLKARRKQVAEELLPDLMASSGLKLMQLDNGTKIRIDEFVDAKIKDAITAFDWLRQTNNESIIKNQITISLERGDDDKAQEVLQNLKESHGIDAEVKISIHNQTLKSFCRDALDNPELAESLPREAFGIYQGKRAKITK